jgi:hypothetical protein
MKVQSRAGIAAGVLAVTLGAMAEGCVQILGLEDPAPGPDGGAGHEAGISRDDATTGQPDSAPGDGGANAPPDALASGCTAGAACTPAAACQQGTTTCDGGAAICTATGPLAGCEGQPVCDDGGCVCKSTCNGSCVNESNDTANCGACGRGCNVGFNSGAQCASRACQPAPIETERFPIGGVAATDSNIYYSVAEPSSGAVKGIDDLGNNTTFSATEFQPTIVRADANNVYWIDVATATDAGALAPSTGRIMMAAATGPVATTVLATGQNYPAGLAIDATGLYWSNSGATGTDGLVVKCSIRFCGRSSLDPSIIETPTQLAMGQSNPLGVALDATNVYWANSGTGTNGQIMKCAIGGCGMAPTVVASGLVFPNEVAVSGASLYWTNSGTSSATGGLVLDGSVMTCPVSGCVGSPTILASNQANPEGIAVDSTGVYWTNFGSAANANLGSGGQVMKCAIAGCGNSPTVVTSNMQGPTEIALNPSLITWGDFRGLVWVLAK